jgi:23S rRNA pseudouridine1911/1915/1917 synthase
MAVLPGGREAVTEFRVVEDLGACSLLEVCLHTGRTHQIRVHLSHVGHPVVGDPAYGRGAARLAAALGLGRPFLHAARLRLAHPLSGEGLDVEEPLPPDLEAALARARAAPRESSPC